MFKAFKVIPSIDLGLIGSHAINNALRTRRGKPHYARHLRNKIPFSQFTTPLSQEGGLFLHLLERALTYSILIG